MNIVGCGRVKNGERYIRRWLDEMLEACDSVCILDDGSTDATPSIIREYAKKCNRVFAHFQKNLPRHGGRDCRVLYEMASALNPDWIFAPDIDEFIDLKQDRWTIRSLAQQSESWVKGWTFPFFYLWNDEQHYRADGDYGRCHVIRLFRFDPNLRPPNRPAHSQLCPDDLDRRLVLTAPIRMIHYGYMDPAEREAKYRYYTERDPDPTAAGGGVKHYGHIIDPNALVVPYPSDAEWYGITPGPDSNAGMRYSDMVDVASGISVAGGFVHHLIAYGLGGKHPKESRQVLGWFLQHRLHRGGRIDVVVPDLEYECAAFTKAADDNAKQAVASRLFNGWTGPRIGAMWESQLGTIMARAGFERVERVPEDPTYLHMIGFKPNG